MKPMKVLSEWMAKPNMQIGQALILISGTHVDHVTHASLDEARNRVRQAAYSGDIKMWGNHAYVDIPAPHDACSPLKEPIPAEYWRHNQIHWMALEPGSVGTLSYDIQYSDEGPIPLNREGNAPIVPHQSDKQDHYYDLYVNRGQLLRQFARPIVLGYWKRLKRAMKGPDSVERQRRKAKRDAREAQKKQRDNWPAY